MRSSIIVVSYNSRTYLLPCIESILAQLRPDDEIIIVDNGSTDGSADFVEATYPGITLIRSSNNGYAGGNNLGAYHASGDYLVFLNPDTVLQPDALDALLVPFSRLPATGLTTACIVYQDKPDIVNTCGNTMHYTGLTYCRGAHRPRTEYSEDAEVDAVSGAAFAIRRELFERLGGFDERFFMYCEDSDLSWRARLLGYQCRYVAAAVVLHDYHPAYSPRKAFYLDRNRHFMLRKNLHASTYLRMLPGLALGEVVTWGFLLLQGPRYWGVKLHVYGWLWKHRAEIHTAYQAVQSERTADERALATQMTYRLEFDQLANRALSLAASALFHPAFWLARQLFAARYAR